MVRSLVVFLAALLLPLSAVAERVRAPIVSKSGDNGVMEQIGWYEYDKQDDAVVLFCVPEQTTMLTCAVFIASDEGNAVVFIGGLKAKEIRS
jgi:hypothetical protein